MFSWLFGSGKQEKQPKAGKAAPKSKKPVPKKPPKSTKPPPPKKVKVKKINLSKRFDLQGRTGQGSMSKVWRARDKQLGRTVCLKVLDKEKTARFEARFVGLNRPNEGMICTALNHDNVVQTFEWGMTNVGEQFLVMELVEGLGLNYLIETKHRQLEGNRVNFLVQAAEGLHYIHEAGFMHRDICPRNIMVTSEGVVKLIDFGLSIPDTFDFRRPGNRTGTANYMAPELIKRVSTDPRVDLFALGVTAFEVLTGNLPWESAQSMETMLSHLNTRPYDPRDFRPDMDEYMVAFLFKSIERDPAERFQSAAEFRDVLKVLPKQDY